jgi:hypothetical protein
MPKGDSPRSVSTSSGERKRVSAPPIAKSEVEAKKAVPFCSEAMMVVSTTRFSRTSIRSIQRCLWAFMRRLRLRPPAAVISTMR